MRTFAAMSNLDVWYARVDLAMVEKMFQAPMAPRDRKVVTKNLAKARTRDSMQAFGKLCGVVDGQTRIIADPPLIMPLSHLLPGERDQSGLEAHLDGLLADYRSTMNGAHRILFQRYQIVDLARKVVGVGSVGTRCWIFLFTARDGTEPLLLQVKEAQPSVLSAFAGPSKYANQGQRVVEGQWLMQPVSDIFLGWQRTDKLLDGKAHDFYVRQLRDWKFSLDIDAMRPSAMLNYGQLCAWTLARAHAKSGDSVAIAAYLGNSDVFDQAIARFASRLRRSDRTRPPGTGERSRNRTRHRPQRHVMDDQVRAYIEGIAPEHRPLFDRLHGLILAEHPDADVVLSYKIPTYKVGRRRLYLGAWQHGVSIYGWGADRDAGFSARHADLRTSKGTIRLRPQDAAAIPDEEFSDLVRAALGP